MSNWETHEAESEAQAVDSGESKASEDYTHVVENTSVSADESGECSKEQSGVFEDLGREVTVVIEFPLGAPCLSEEIASYRLEGETGVDPWDNDANCDKKE